MKIAVFEPILFAKAFLTLILDPERTDQIFRLAELGIRGKDQRGAEAVLERARADSGFTACYRERYIPETPDLNRLASMPKDSLGQVLGSQMLESGLDPEFYEKISPTDELRYLELRLRQTHDIWHTLTGFSTDVEGELGLQAFMLAQTHSGISAAILAAGFLHFIIKEPKKLPRAMDLIVDGYAMGKRARYLLGFRLEQFWERPLSEVRAIVGLGSSVADVSLAYGV